MIERRDLSALQRSRSEIEVVLTDGSSRTCDSGDFEPTEHGALLGRTLIPWHRVRYYSWPLPVTDVANEDEERVRARVRLVLADGEEHTIAADKFETGPWTVTAILDDLADTETGQMHRRRVIVPWHGVSEVERLGVEAPARPD
jgi:hypothetical protein